MISVSQLGFEVVQILCQKTAPPTVFASSVNGTSKSLSILCPMVQAKYVGIILNPFYSLNPRRQPVNYKACWFGFLNSSYISLLRSIAISSTIDQVTTLELTSSHFYNPSICSPTIAQEMSHMRKLCLEITYKSFCEMVSVSTSFWNMCLLSLSVLNLPWFLCILGTNYSFCLEISLSSDNDYVDFKCCINITFGFSELLVSIDHWTFTFH